MALRTRTPWARALLPATRCRASGQLGALLSSPVLDVRLLTALQVLQEVDLLTGAQKKGLKKKRHTLNTKKRPTKQITVLLSRCLEKDNPGACARGGRRVLAGF